MRRPKHRHHPDIWRERHLAHELGRRRWFRGPAGSVAREILRDPQPRRFTEADFLAALHDVWNDLEPLDMATPYTPGRVR